MIKELVESIKENPSEFIIDSITLVAIFAFGYFLLILGAVLTGNI
jgi:hypothetical protein|tara:strand:+ start:146 stop:280 length:135 start_codon:yes stop_codon:yes gene_type:complete